MHFKNPIFGNSYNQDTNIIVRKLSSGEVRVVSDTNWPNIKNMHVEFRGLDLDSRDELMNYYRAIAGNEITLTDHEGIVWTGFIIDEPVIRREADNCMYFTSFTFQGTKE